MGRAFPRRGKPPPFFNDRTPCCLADLRLKSTSTDRGFPPRAARRGVPSASATSWTFSRFTTSFRFTSTVFSGFFASFATRIVASSPPTSRPSITVPFPRTRTVDSCCSEITRDGSMISVRRASKSILLADRRQVGAERSSLAREEVTVRAHLLRDALPTDECAADVDPSQRGLEIRDRPVSHVSISITGRAAAPSFARERSRAPSTLRHSATSRPRAGPS